MAARADAARYGVAPTEEEEERIERGETVEFLVGGDAPTT
jgi:hypothetical protein